MGLAEQSPHLPLKVLHAELEHPDLAVVGISNWVLDPAKINRVRAVTYLLHVSSSAVMVRSSLTTITPTQLIFSST